MTDWIAFGVGGGAGLVLMGLFIGVALSIPWIAARAFQVLLRREGVPVSYNLRSLAKRRVATASTFAVLALVVFALTGVMMLAEGIAHTLAATGDPLNVKVMPNRARTEWTSWLGPDQIQLLAAAPGVETNGAGAPMVSGEMVVLVWAPRADAQDVDAGANLTVRGVGPVAFDVHALRITEGRNFAPGTREIVVGRALRGRFQGAELGGYMSFADQEWAVVGIADHGGTAHDSEIWGDIDVMRPTFRRGVSTATVRMTDRDSIDALREALAAHSSQSELVARREVDYWRALAKDDVEFVILLGASVALIFSFGAILGALNTMYGQVAARTRELGTLRAIGFKPRAILVSVVLESVLLSLAGGVFGVLGASLLGMVQFRLTSSHTLSEITYGFHLTPGLALLCLGFAAWIGYVGGLLPALRAARMRIPNAVRAD